MNADMKVSIGQQIPGFVELISSHDAALSFPSVINSLNNLALMYAETWKSFAQGTAKMPGQPKVLRMRGGSEYIASIRVDVDRPFIKTIMADGDKTDRIEKGAEEVDLKPGLLKGPKARQGKYGPFNIVAFRHDAPSAAGTAQNPMPINVYRVAKKLAPSMATGVKNGRQEYSWDGKMSASAQGQRTKLKTGYTWKSGKYAGMVHMQDVTTRAKNAGYMTFRCVSYASDPQSWIIPAKPGVPIREAVVAFMRPIAEKEIARAFEEDLKR